MFEDIPSVDEQFLNEYEALCKKYNRSLRYSPQVAIIIDVYDSRNVDWVMEGERSSRVMALNTPEQPMNPSIGELI